MANILDAIRQVRQMQDALQRRQLRRQRFFRDREIPFDLYGEEEFRKRFRFGKHNARYIIDLIADDVRQATSRNKALPPHMQVLLALRFYGNGAFQITVGDHLKIDQATVSRVLKRVSIALANRRAQFVKMSRTQRETRHTQEAFYRMHQFPNVISLIDCTHVRISNPGGEDAARFINRKGYHSVNTQVTCDADCRITNIVARWYGSAHDSRIFNESRLKADFEAGRISGNLLGDSGYACLR